MPEITKALVVGGFSEDHGFLEAFTREVAEGPNRLVDEAESITLAQGFAEIDKINQEAKNRMVFMHSAGALVIREAGLVIALNGAEPTGLFRTVVGAVKVSTNRKIGREDHVSKPGPKDAFLEVLHHPSTLKVPFLVRKFSTLQLLIDGGEEVFPAGRFYLPRRDDEFGFGNDQMVALAIAKGINAKMLDGYHKQPLLHPRKAVEEISELLNTV